MCGVLCDPRAARSSCSGPKTKECGGPSVAGPPSHPSCLPHSGPAWIVCEDPTTEPKGPLFFWSYMYFLSKFYELLDTVLQMLKGRRPPHYFLHVYHHVVVMFTTWGWLEYGMTLQYIGMLWNTFVHVVMYYYYYLKSQGVPRSGVARVIRCNALTTPILTTCDVRCHTVLWDKSQHWTALI